MGREGGSEKGILCSELGRENIQDKDKDYQNLITAKMHKEAYEKVWILRGNHSTHYKGGSHALCVSLLNKSGFEQVTGYTIEKRG